MQLVTSKELAAMLSVSPRTIESWGNYRGLPKVVISRRCVRYDPMAITRWLVEQGAFQATVRQSPRKRDQFSMY